SDNSGDYNVSQDPSLSALQAVTRPGVPAGKGAMPTWWRTQDPLPVRMLSITDGTSNTLLIGEKHVRPDQLGKADTADFDGCIYNGDAGNTVARVAGPNFTLAAFPTDGSNSQLRFGSWHAAVCNFVFCDGSVRSLSVSIDGTNLGYLANRADGQVYNGPPL